jgi:hypothetical protein
MLMNKGIAAAMFLSLSPIVWPAASNPSSSPTAGTPGLASPSGTITPGHPPLWQYGPFAVRPHLAYNGSYQDGILVRPGVPNNTYVDTYTAGIQLNFGPRWSIDYTPSWVAYSNHAFRNTLNHDVMANGSLLWAGASIGAQQAYSYSSIPLIVTGRQTNVEVISTKATAAYQFGPKYSVETSVEQTLTFVSASEDFYQWSAEGFIRSQLFSRVSGSLGVRSGYAVVFKSADMVFAQPGGDLTWSPTNKLSLSGRLFVDERVIFARRRWRWLENPVYAGSVNFAPFTTTALQANVGRTIAPSLFAGQTSDTTLWSASATQRFLQHFWVSGGLDYQDARYLTVGGSAAVRRKDNTWTYRAGLRTTFLRRGAIAFSYEETDHHSNVPGFSQRSRRIGCDVSYRY